LPKLRRHRGATSAQLCRRSKQIWLHCSDIHQSPPDASHNGCRVSLPGVCGVPSATLSKDAAAPDVAWPCQCPPFDGFGSWPRLRMPNCHGTLACDAAVSNTLVVWIFHCPSISLIAHCCPPSPSSFCIFPHCSPCLLPPASTAAVHLRDTASSVGSTRCTQLSTGHVQHRIG